MRGLLSNPVIGGLLAGPTAVRAREQQRVAQMLPRSGGGMMGAPGPIIDRSGGTMAGLGQGLAGLGQGFAAVGQARKAEAQREAFEQTIASLPPEQQALARLNPEEYAKQAAIAAFRDSDPLTINNTALFDVDGLPKRMPLAEGIRRDLPEWIAPKDLKLYGTDKTGYYTIEKGQDGRPIKSMLIAPAGAAPTSMQQNFEYARKQGFDGSFTDFISATRQSTVERAPQGYKVTDDGNLQPIPGGPADPKTIADTESAKKTAAFEAKRVEMFPKAQSAFKALETNSETVINTIDKAMEQIGPWTTGYANLLLSGLPQTDARDLERNLETIKANIGFDRLQQMRDNSPTGGALGQVSEFENRLLQAVQGSLDPTQTTTQLKENLSRVRELYKATLDDRRRAFRQDYGDLLPTEDDDSVSTELPTLNITVTPPPPEGFVVVD